MTDIKKLKTDFEQAEAKAQKLMADKDEAIEKIRDRYGDRLRNANQDTAEKQKLWLDAQAAEGLLDRPDGEAIAHALGLSLPNE